MTNRTKPRRSDTSSRETEGNKVELSTCTDWVPRCKEGYCMLGGLSL